MSKPLQAKPITTESAYTYPVGLSQIERISESLFRVTSSRDKSIKYLVNMTTGTCDCPVNQYKHIQCKHIGFISDLIKAMTIVKPKDVNFIEEEDDEEYEI